MVNKERARDWLIRNEENDQLEERGETMQREKRNEEGYVTIWPSSFLLFE